MEAWGPVVLRWCTWLARPGADPEDATHDVLVAVLSKLDSLRDAQAFQAWLFSIVRRQVARHGRKRWLWPSKPEPRAEPEDPGPGPQREVERKQARLAVQRVLSTLSRRHREVLVLCLLEERTCREAAQLLGIPEGTAKRRLQAARQRFRRAWARQLRVAALRHRKEET